MFMPTQVRIKKSARKRILKFFKVEKITRLEEFIKQKDKEINLEGFLPGRARELFSRHALNEASAHMLLEAHERVIDALNLPKSKARIIKHNLAFVALATRAAKSPIKVERLTKMTQQALNILTVMLHEQKERQSGRIESLLQWQDTYKKSLKFLEKKDPNSRITLTEEGAKELSGIFNVSISRYLSKEQNQLLKFEREKYNEIMKRFAFEITSS